MNKLDHTGTDRLRKGRFSIPGALYFITACTKTRKPGLTTETVSGALIEALRELHQSTAISLHCATVMPDHIHSLFTLGRTLTLSQTQGKFKRLTKSVLQPSGLEWQENYYDHRIRQDGFIEPFARYIFMNPYRKKLIPISERWPTWVLNRNYRPEFHQHLIDESYPPAKWLENGETAKSLIQQDLLENKVEN
jgi:REP element-mobilizing transposase RayT